MKKKPKIEEVTSRRLKVRLQSGLVRRLKKLGHGHKVRLKIPIVIYEQARRSKATVADSVRSVLDEAEPLLRILTIRTQSARARHVLESDLQFQKRFREEDLEDAEELTRRIAAKHSFRRRVAEAHMLDVSISASTRTLLKQVALETDSDLTHVVFTLLLLSATEQDHDPARRNTELSSSE